MKPISYTWDKGRLASVIYSDATNGTKTYSFTYDGYGRRIGKSYTFTVGSTVPTSYIASAITNYTYDTKGKLIKENYTATSNTSSTTTKEIMYLYDESSIVGIIYTVNGTSATYYLDKNIKGDVIGIIDENGTTIVKYGYDSWGNCSVLSSTNSTISGANSIRYRGYYLDSETGFYCLGARFYNPKWRRFISPDSTEYIDPEFVNGINLYAYCSNDPVNYSDPSGNSFIAAVLIGAAIGALLGFGATVLADYADDGEVFNDSISAGDYVANTIAAGALGALAGGLGYAVAPVIGQFMSGGLAPGALAVANGEMAAVLQLSVGGALAASGIGILLFASDHRPGNNKAQNKQIKDAIRQAGHNPNDPRIKDEINKMETFIRRHKIDYGWKKLLEFVKEGLG